MPSSSTKLFIIEFFSYKLLKMLRSYLPSFSTPTSPIPIYFLMVSKALLISCSFAILFLYSLSILSLDYFLSSIVFSLIRICSSRLSSCSFSICLDLINCLNLMSCWMSLLSFSHYFLNWAFFCSACSFKFFKSFSA